MPVRWQHGRAYSRPRKGLHRSRVTDRTLAIVGWEASFPEGLGEVAPRRNPMRLSEIGVYGARSGDVVECGTPSLGSDLLHVGQRSQLEIVGVEIIGALPLHPRDFGLPERRFERPDNAFGDLILQLEDIV